MSSITETTILIKSNITKEKLHNTTSELVNEFKNLTHKLPPTEAKQLIYDISQDGFSHLFTQDILAQFYATTTTTADMLSNTPSHRDKLLDNLLAESIV